MTLEQVRQKYIDLVYDCKTRTDKDAVRQGVEWVYELSKLPKPLVLFGTSPRHCQYIAMAVESICDTEAEISAHDPQEYYKLALELMAQEAKYEPHVWAWYIDVADYGWVSYYDHQTLEGKLNNEKFDRYKDFIQKGIFASLQFDYLCIICDMPKHIDWIELNGVRRLHADSGPAITFHDNTGGYYWRGVKVPKQLIMNPDSITREDFVGLDNVEVRRAYAERLGTARLLTLLDTEVVDEDTDNQGNIMKLLRTKDVDNLAGDHIYFYSCKCPSSMREYLLTVPPGTNVWEAKAWTFGKQTAEFQPTQET